MVRRNDPPSWSHSVPVGGSRVFVVSFTVKSSGNLRRDRVLAREIAKTVKAAIASERKEAGK